MEYLVTFYTHYGAMRFHKQCKREGAVSRLLPVPRALSASCGVCVRVEADAAPKEAEHADLESCYTTAPDGAYVIAEE